VTELADLLGFDSVFRGVALDEVFQSGGVIVFQKQRRGSCYLVQLFGEGW
jgi:hypothetical protein